jgi:hydroxymethylglutaryl-CoA lyase
VRVTALEIRDVCPRDGLQDHGPAVPTATKAELVRKIHAAGVRSIEMTSFVSPKVVPQLADAAQLISLLPPSELPGTVRSVFVATAGGLERALAAGVDEISTTIPATDGMTQANFRRDRDQMLSEVTAMPAAMPDGVGLSITIAVAFGCPYDGEVPADGVMTLAGALAEAGYRRIFLGDTIGVGTPHQVAFLFRQLSDALPEVRLGAHFHDARGAGVANVIGAVDCGATLIDTSLGGLGGCPFAPGAAGNVATEDVVWVLEDMGFSTGVNTTGIVDSARWLAQALDVPLRSRTPTARRFDWENRAAASTGGQRPTPWTHDD